MTIFLADIASYQRGLTPTNLLDAGFTAVNVKVSHGLTQKSVATDAASWLSDARFERSTFHWLTKNASGAEQARYAYARMKDFGAHRVGFAHVVDVEEAEVTWTQYNDYVVTMTSLLGRPILTYTGDWYWPRVWRGIGISPWLHAAPNAGYLGSYPGDDSAHWRAGYGGWPELSVMQYAVAKVAGIAVSMSAVRDPVLWHRMRGLMAQSQNGWPVVQQSACVERVIGGAPIVNGWLKGDVDAIFTDLAMWLDLKIERSITPGCWGHNVRKIEGSDDFSNHSSGTAFDYNAPNHPMGKAETYSEEDQAEIRARLKNRYRGVVRWGADFRRPDDMHFEINDDPAAVKAVTDMIRNEQEDDMSAADVQAINAHTTRETNRLIAEINQVDDEVWAKELLNPFSGQMQQAGVLLRYIGSNQGHADTRALVNAVREAEQAVEGETATQLGKVLALLESLLELHSEEQPPPEQPETPAGA